MRDLLQPLLGFTTTLALISAIACSDGQKESQYPTPGAQDGSSRGQDLDPESSGQDSETQDSKDNSQTDSEERQRLNPGDQPGESRVLLEAPNDPSVRGKFQVRTYTQGLQDSAYQSAMIFYPQGAEEGRKLPATTLSGGYSNTKESMQWMGEHLASHGMIVIAFTPTNNFSTDPSFWSRGHAGAFKKVQEEGARSASPIKGMVDPKRIGIMGFSMGGAGTILAVDAVGGQAAAAIALCPYQPSVPRANTPILYITGSNDTTARPGPVINAYERTQTGGPKGLQNIQGLGHGDIIRSNTYRSKLARTITSWMGLYVGANDKFRDFLDANDLKTTTK